MISALQLAAPYFQDMEKSCRLHKSDAGYVECIHTNWDSFGLKEPIGHSDIYPNRGKFCFKF